MDAETQPEHLTEKMESKTASDQPDVQRPPSPAAGTTISWTEKEERLVKLKLDLYLMPLLVAGFFVLQLDRSNISNALTSTLTTDLHITSDQVSAGNQLMAAGTVLAEIPSNLLLQRVGAPAWMTLLLGVWGTIALAQAWATGRASFYATRFMLGLSEGGCIPGAQYVLALFYRADELAMRTAVLYFGNYFSTATGSLVAAGILRMAGTRGLAGWQWLFVLEGALTLLVFLLFLLLVPRSPAHTRPVHALFDVFTPRDRAIMQARVLLGNKDPSKAAARGRITWPAFRAAVLDVRPWLHFALNVVALTPKGGLQLYGPTIIKSLGFDATHANLLNSVSSYLVVVLSCGVALASDRTGRRGVWCVVSFVWALVFAAALLGVGTGADRWVRYALFTLLGGGNALAQGLNDAWCSANARSPVGRSLRLAMAVMGSNIGGIAGPALFRAGDAPRYVHGFAAVLGLYAASIVVTLVLMAVYAGDNRRARREADVEVDGEGDRGTDAVHVRRFQL